MQGKADSSGSDVKGPSPFKKIHFSTDGFSANEAVEAYREIFGAIIKHDIVPIGDEPFRFTSTLCSLPGLGWATSAITPCHRLHAKQHVDSDDFILGIGLSGGCVVEQRGREATIGRAEAVLTTSAHPGEVLIPTASQSISVRLTSSALRRRIPGIDDRTIGCIQGNTAGLQLLRGYLGALREADLAKPHLHELVVDHVYDLAALIVGVQGDERKLAQDRGARAARLGAVLREIERRSDDVGVNAIEIAKRLGITPRYVHLLLEGTGRTFSHHLLERRLEKALLLLGDPRSRSRRITDIATEAGFTDLSYFNRTFRRRYGATPSDIRAAAAARRD